MSWDSEKSQKVCETYEYIPTTQPDNEEDETRISDFYLKGTLNNTNWDKEFYLTPVENSTNLFTYTLTDCEVDVEFKVFQYQGSDWGFDAVEQNKAYFAAAGEHSNIKVLVPGTYVFTFNSETHKLSFEHSGDVEPSDIETEIENKE